MNPTKPSELFVACNEFLGDRLPDPRDTSIVQGSASCVQHLLLVLEPDGHQANLLPMRKALAHTPFSSAFLKALKFQIFRDGVVFDHFKKATNGGQAEVRLSLLLLLILR